MGELLERVVVPVADEDVAAATAEAARDYLADDSEVILVHVVKEDDYASEGEWEAFAEQAFDRVRGVLGEERISTEIRHGEDVADTVFTVAEEVDASAVAFRSRGGSRWRQIMAGDVAREFVTDAELPVVVLPQDDK